MPAMHAGASLAAKDALRATEISLAAAAEAVRSDQPGTTLLAPVFGASSTASASRRRAHAGACDRSAASVSLHDDPGATSTPAAHAWSATTACTASVGPTLESEHGLSARTWAAAATTAANATGKRMADVRCALARTGGGQLGRLPRHCTVCSREGPGPS